jgi:crotonobetainyl-CoA:carnitine CoA-transferase CaiB-like acyl-CoA transferase
MSVDARDRPLDGVCVVDLTNVLAGPYATYQLALLGAEVIKVEVPGRGDLARRLGAAEELNDVQLGASFIAQNAGKKSVELDLKSASGRERLERLLVDADVLTENFRPGVLARLGFPWERLRELNPRLVYCAISGFGQTGSMRDRPAYDQIIQGLSGMMSVTGTAETGPLRAGFPVCDTLGGLAAALAVSAALAGRERTGRGCRIDVSLLEVAISAMGWVVSNFLATGVEPQPMANENFTAAPSGAFEAADGLLNVAANQQAQFETLCRLMGRPDLFADPRFATAASRKRHRTGLKDELETTLRTRPAAEWEERLNAAGVPAARVLSVSDALGLEQLSERRFFHELPSPDGADSLLRVVGSGVQFDGEPLHAATPPPLLGQHTAELAPEHAPA